MFCLAGILFYYFFCFVFLFLPLQVKVFKGTSLLHTDLFSSFFKSICHRPIISNACVCSGGGWRGGLRASEGLGWERQRAEGGDPGFVSHWLTFLYLDSVSSPPPPPPTPHAQATSKQKKKIRFVRIWNRVRPRTPVQNQQTRESISPRKTSHSRKDWAELYGCMK